MESSKYIQIQYKAYGSYRGSYDGGGIGNTLYWNIDKAREECLKEVSEIDKESSRMLSFCLKDANKSKELIKHARKQYRPMEETKKNFWTNGIDEVMVKEFDIK